MCMEPAFKKRYLGSWEGFELLLSFNEALGKFIHSHSNWPPQRFALQVMTEPFVNIGDWSIMTARQWEAVRCGAPTLILFLSSDLAGNMESLKTKEPVQNKNVCYCFTTCES
ncbi:MAG: hypothetical protein Q4C95_08705 [Planctomycetia bacterium]|nr:hypothetical protein [Planctomycetia bacterium]